MTYSHTHSDTRSPLRANVKEQVCHSASEWGAMVTTQRKRKQCRDVINTHVAMLFTLYALCTSWLTTTNCFVTV